MADVFSPTWVESVPNVRAAGATSLLVKIASDVAYYDLGAPRDVKLNGKSLFKADTWQRPLGWGLKNTWMVPTIQASEVEMKILDALVLNPLVGFQVKQMDSIYIKDATPLHALSWKAHSSGDFDNFRYIEYTFEGNIKNTEWDALFSGTGVTIGTPTNTDLLFTLAQSHIFADQVPNGLSKVEFKASADAAYANLGEFNKAIWTIECITVPGGGGRQLPRTIALKFTLDVHGMQTGLVETQLMDEIVSNSIDLKLTHMNGDVLTLSNTSFATQPTYTNDGNDDKERSIDLKMEGTLVKNSTGTSFVDGAGTAWGAMWT